MYVLNGGMSEYALFWSYELQRAATIYVTLFQITVLHAIHF